MRVTNPSDKTIRGCLYSERTYIRIGTGFGTQIGPPVHEVCAYDDEFRIRPGQSVSWEDSVASQLVSSPGEIDVTIALVPSSLWRPGDALRRVLVVMAVYAALRCSPGGATIVGENACSQEVSDIGVAVSGREYEVGALKPGEVRAFSGRPNGESAAGVSYRVRGRSVTVPPQGYFEASGYYVVLIRVDGAGATIKTRIKATSPS